MSHRADEKDPKDPSTTSGAYDRMVPRWAKMAALLGGTESMRAAGEAYLPQHEEETDRAYGERLSKAVLYNQTELTLEALVGRPFSDPVLPVEAPPAVETLLEDVDLQGNNVGAFARTWFRDGLANALSHVLVDMPRPRTEGDLGRPRTLADDRDEGLRPYWIHVSPQNLLAAHARVIDGEEVLVHVRIAEEVVEMDGFAETRRERIRELNLAAEGVVVQIWEKRKVDGKEQWVSVEEFLMQIPVIPLVTFYANRAGLMEGKPPLSDLADLNVSHWQGGSDQTMVLTTARFPILAASGVAEGSDKIPVGPNISLVTADPEGRFYYVEHTGAAIEAGANDQLEIERRMADYGAQFLKRRPGGETATARALDSAEATSPLQDMALRFQDSLNLALWFTSLWARVDEPGRLEIQTDFGPETADANDLQTLAKTREMRDISRAAYLAELKRRGALDDEFDAEEDAAQLERESMSGADDGDSETDLTETEEEEEIDGDDEA